MRDALCQWRGCNYQLRDNVLEVLFTLQLQGSWKPEQGWVGHMHPTRAERAWRKGLRDIYPLLSPSPRQQRGTKTNTAEPHKGFLWIFFFLFFEATWTALPFKWSRGVYLVSDCMTLASAFGAGATNWEGNPVVSNKCPAWQYLPGEKIPCRKRIFSKTAGQKLEPDKFKCKIRHRQAIYHMSKLLRAELVLFPLSFGRSVDVHTGDVTESNPSDLAQYRA